MDLLKISSHEDFADLALETFRFQAHANPVYKQWLELLQIIPTRIQKLENIPYLPIRFFKSHDIISGHGAVEQTFISSGTTGMIPSKHQVLHLDLYDASLSAGFRYFFGDPSTYTLLALLPSYLEREGSSLVYMMNQLIIESDNPSSGFYLHNLKELSSLLKTLEAENKPALLVGVSYALLDLADQFPMTLKSTRIIETGGMKGHREEMVRDQLHLKLKKAFNTENILSEYGMTELLSQAWSMGGGRFQTPPWMKIRIRDPYNPLDPLPDGKTGGIDVIDLANRYSCSFIQTQDLGRKDQDDSFEVLGRFDNSELRGCNLLIS